MFPTPPALCRPVASRRTFLAGLAGTAAAGLVAGRARAATPIRFSCDYRPYGSTAPFFHAEAAGLFGDQGVAATIDGSQGSSDAITRVASGAYDFGCADVGTLVEFATRNPDIAPKLVMPIYDRFPGCIVSLGHKPVTKFKDLEGLKLGISAADAGSRLLPVLLRLKQVDASKISMMVIDPHLRDTMLIKRQVDAVVGFDYTVLFNLTGNGFAAEDIKFLYFSDNGFDFYGQGLIAARHHVDGDPELVGKVAAAVAGAWVAAIKDPAAVIASVVKRDPLLDPQVETARLLWVLDHHVLTANVRANGLGTLDPARLDAGIKIVAEGFGLDAPATGSTIYDGRFLPPLAARRVN
jgi:NitT/TauT family transport system substrate-binding protein